MRWRCTGGLDTRAILTFGCGQPANVTRLIHKPDAFGFASPGFEAQDFLEPQALVQLGYPPARIDLLTTIDGITFAEAFENQVHFETGNLKFPVISVDDFIRNKLATGRTQDQKNVEALRSRSSESGVGESAIYCNDH